MKQVYDVVKPSKKSDKQRDLAKAVARKGRKGDTQIVHMAPNEVRALDKISKATTGQKLTKNPKTGAYEAFKLKKVLGIVAPIVAGIFGGPPAAAAASAAVTKANGGSWKEAALSGIGSWAAGQALGANAKGVDGAMKSGALSQSADASVAEASKQAAADATTQAATDATAQAANSTAAQAAQAPSWKDLSMGDKLAVAKDQFRPGMAMMAYQAHSGAADMAQAREDELQSEADAWWKRKKGESLLDQGLNGAFHYAEGGPVARSSPFSQDASQFYGQAFKPAFDFSQYDPAVGPQIEQDTTILEALPVSDVYQKKVPFGFGGTKSPVNKIFGRKVKNFSATAAKQAEANRLYAAAQQAQMGGGAYNGPAFSPYEQAFWAPGVPLPQMHNNATKQGLADYFRFAGGGPIVGPGDGMSDSIPAVIDDQQPAKIASGEYVIPADAVSHFGNGDTNAGFDYLDKQVAAVRKASTGSAKQRNKINPWDYMR